jgi:spermidine synthase
LVNFTTYLEVKDDKIHSSEKDEFIRHEAPVDPAMLTNPKAKKICIAGK